MEGRVDKIDVGVDLKYELIVDKDDHCVPCLCAIVIPIRHQDSGPRKSKRQRYSIGGRASIRVGLKRCFRSPEWCFRRIQEKVP